MSFSQPVVSRVFGYSVFLTLNTMLLMSGCQSPPVRQEPTAVSIARATLPSPPPPARLQFSEEILKLQIFLEGKDFGPGLVDGRKGSFTNKVLRAYESLHGPVLTTDFQSITPYTSYKIREEDLARIGKMGSSPQQIALQRNQPYTELIAFISERYHTSRAFLREINPAVDFSLLHAGDSVRVPNVSAPFRIENYSAAAKTPPDHFRKNRSIQVDTQARLLKVLNGDQPIALFPITPGSSDLPAPPGTWIIRGIVAMPWYRYDAGMLNHGIRTKNFYMLPPGPRSPVGILFAGINKPGIGIHGTGNPETIGRSASHGCIRLSNWDAARFRELVTVGNTVIIR